MIREVCKPYVNRNEWHDYRVPWWMLWGVQVRSEVNNGRWCRYYAMPGTVILRKREWCYDNNFWTYREKP